MRVVVAEDDLLVREGVVRVLVNAGHDVVAAVGDHDALISAVEADEPDACVIDIRMPPTHRDEGLVAARTIRECHPEVAVLVLSQFVDDTYAEELLSTGERSVGYLLKDRLLSSDELVRALADVAGGAVVIDRALVRELLERRRVKDPLARLSGREREVLTLMAEGRADRAIAAALCLSVKTVESHVRSILTKLDLPDDPNANRRVLAVLRWLRS